LVFRSQLVEQWAVFINRSAKNEHQESHQHPLQSRLVQVLVQACWEACLELCYGGVERGSDGPRSPPQCTPRHAPLANPRLDEPAKPQADALVLDLDEKKSLKEIECAAQTTLDAVPRITTMPELFLQLGRSAPPLDHRPARHRHQGWSSLDGEQDARDPLHCLRLEGGRAWRAVSSLVDRTGSEK